MKKFYELFKAVQIIHETDVKSLYEDMVKTIESWMRTLPLIGRTEIPLHETEHGKIIAIFDFTKKKFSIEFTSVLKESFFWLIGTYGTFEPFWYKDFIRMSLFLGKIDEVIEELRKRNEKLEEELSYLIDFVKRLNQELPSKLQSLEIKLAREALVKGLVKMP